MIKRCAIVALFCTAMAGIAGTAQAHYVYTLSGWFYHSVRCDFILKGVQDPAKQDAFVECTVGGVDFPPSLVEVLCYNPNTHDVQPGRVGSTIQLVGVTPIDTSSFDKVKGKASDQVYIDDSILLSHPEWCVNPNWIPVKALIREMTTQMTTWVCTAKDTSLCDQVANPENYAPYSRAKATCTLAAKFTFDNPPTPDVDAYDCPADRQRIDHLQ